MARVGRDPRARRCALLERQIRPGVTTAELDAAAERFIRSQGGVPTFKGYRGFPGSICASPNSMIVHGIPGPYALERGDLISLDVGVTLDGWVADAARTFPVGAVGALAQNLLEGTEQALFAGVEQCRRRQPPRRRLARDPGGRRGRAGWRSSARSSATASAAACTRIPQIPNFGEPGTGPAARGGDGARDRADDHRRARPRVRAGDDGWAIYSQDGSLAAHFEFTVAITADGPRSSRRGTCAGRRRDRLAGELG